MWGWRFEENENQFYYFSMPVSFPLISSSVSSWMENTSSPLTTSLYFHLEYNLISFRFGLNWTELEFSEGEPKKNCLWFSLFRSVWEFTGVDGMECNVRSRNPFSREFYINFYQLYMCFRLNWLLTFYMTWKTCLPCIIMRMKMDGF